MGGDRVREIRKRRGLSQRELASVSGLSLSYIKKLEQGTLPDTRMETLRKIALALRVPTSRLLAERETADQADQPTTDLWRPVRSALEGRSANFEEQPTVSGVSAALDSILPLFGADDYAQLAAVLPSLLRDADALGDDGRAVRSRLLHLTGWLFTQTRQFTSADLALRRAEDDADNRLDAAAIINTRCWLLIRDGRIAETQGLASKWADRMEPRMSSATPAELSAWGWLLIRVSAAAIRDTLSGGADDAIKLARAAAVAMGREYAPPSRLPTDIRTGNSSDETRGECGCP